MIKVLHLIDNLRSGGKERQFVELLKGLCREPDLDNRVLVMARDVFYREIFSLPRVRVDYLVRRCTHDPRIFWTLFRRCRRERPDVLTVWDSMTAIYAVPTVRMLGIRLVNAMIQGAPERLPAALRLRAALTFPLSDAIVANSRAGLDAYGVRSVRADVIRNGFDLGRIRHLQDPWAVRRNLGLSTPLVVGMVATFKPAKDYETFVRAAELVLRRRTDVTFVAVGEGSTRRATMQSVSERHRDKILFLGEQTDVESIINIFDIGVLATFTEGISNSVMEYMVLGKPVIATDGGGTRELVADHEVGFLVGPKRPHELADRVIHLLDHPELREGMGAAGRERIRRLFSLEAMTAAHARLYRRLAVTAWRGLALSEPGA